MIISGAQSGSKPFEGGNCDEGLNGMAGASGSRRPQVGPTPPHLVKKEELEKAIRFIKELVQATERALEQGGPLNKAAHWTSNILAP